MSKQSELPTCLDVGPPRGLDCILVQLRSDVGDDVAAIGFDGAGWVKVGAAARLGNRQRGALLGIGGFLWLDESLHPQAILYYIRKSAATKLDGPACATMREASDVGSPFVSHSIGVPVPNFEK